MTTPISPPAGPGGSTDMPGRDTYDVIEYGNLAGEERCLFVPGGVS